MHRFFIDKITGNKAVIVDKEQLHHLRDVLRLKVDDEVELADADGNDYSGIITSIDRKRAEVKVFLKKAAGEDTLKLTVACAIPKNTRFDEVIDFLTQLGVERIIPMLTERVVVKLDETKAAERHQRWIKIAQNAARQSQRTHIPDIEQLTDFAGVISQAGDYELKLIPNLNSERKLIRNIIAEHKPRNIIVLIGPEGDFTPDEVALAVNNGFLPVSLGDTVLRVATAAIAVASYIKFAIGD
jgi:16S rRNA (uracil1498-N3)-methyltransferase